MDNSFLVIFDLIALGCGAYCIFTYMKLRMAGRLFPNSILIPNGKKPSDCEDAEEYIRYIGPRLLILGIYVSVFGIISLVNEYLNWFNLLVSEIITGLSLVMIIWYAVCNSRANKRFWN